MYIPKEPTRVSGTQRQFIQYQMDKFNITYHQAVRACIDMAIHDTCWRPVSTCNPSTWVTNNDLPDNISDDGSGV